MDILDEQGNSHYVSNFNRVGSIYVLSISNNQRVFTERPTWETLMDEYRYIENTNRLIKPEELAICDCCDREMEITEAVSFSNTDVLYCRDCYDNSDYTERCSHCDRLFLVDDYEREVDEVYNEDDSYVGDWCESCREDHDVYWDEDNERLYIPSTNGRRRKVQFYYNPDGVLAVGTRCHECQDSDDGWCVKHTIQKAKEKEIEATNLWIYDVGRRDYHASDHRRFKGLKYRMPHERPYLYYGIELEALWDNKYNREEVVEEFIRATGGMFVAEYDRSVDIAGDSTCQVGAEFISRPTSYARWMDKDTIIKLKKGLDVLKKYGAKSPQHQDCGLHIHMSKTFFEKNTTKKVSEIKADMDWFFQYYEKEISKLSRRDYTQYCASKAFRLNNQSNVLERGLSSLKGKLTLEKSGMTISQGSGATHHDCIIETQRTIEARTFRSSIDYKEILASIEFCRALAHNARNKTGLEGKTFGEIIYAKDSMYLVDVIEKLKIDTSRKLKNKLEVTIK